jgi:hypothetical protein
MGPRCPSLNPPASPFFLPSIHEYVVASTEDAEAEVAGRYRTSHLIRRSYSPAEAVGPKPRACPVKREPIRGDEWRPYVVNYLPG